MAKPTDIERQDRYNAENKRIAEESSELYCSMRGLTPQEKQKVIRSMLRKHQHGQKDQSDREENEVVSEGREVAPESGQEEGQGLRLWQENDEEKVIEVNFSIT